jgi:GNAT superfamily N-acetyltransferase
MADVNASEQSVLRLAELSDEAALRELIERSFRELARGHYSEAQIAAALGTVIRLDVGLIADRSYFVIEHANLLVASGGYSTRLATIPGEDLAGKPEVRAMFVAPEHKGQGHGFRLLRHVEEQIRKLGHVQSHLLATQSGVAFYRRAGYHADAPHALTMPSGLTLPLTLMSRVL